ncbi:MAG: LptE family protein [Flavobacteriales bacterium]
MVQFCRISILFLTLALSSCKGGYSFTGGNVGDAKTMQVDFFDNNAQIVNPETSQWMTEAIKDIFVQQTPLELVQGPADMYISGEINEYSLRPQAARGPSEVAQMLFTISVQVEFINELAPENNFNARFSRSRPYDADLNFSDIENELAAEIIKELREDVLNRAIANW